MCEKEQRPANCLLPFVLLGLVLLFNLFGEEYLCSLDISFALYHQLRGVLISAPPVLFFFWLVIAAVRFKQAGSPVFFAKSIGIFLLVLLFSLTWSNGSRENFRIHDCREGLKNFFANGSAPLCSGRHASGDYLFFEKNDSATPLPLAMDLPGNHRRICNVLYSDGCVFSLDIRDVERSCEAALKELNRLRPLPPETFARMLQQAREQDEKLLRDGEDK